jgi:hypothetical protein
MWTWNSRPIHFVCVYHRPRFAQRQHRVDAVLQNLGAPRTATNLGGGDALGDLGLDLVYAL